MLIESRGGMCHVSTLSSLGIEPELVRMWVRRAASVGCRQREAMVGDLPTRPPTRWVSEGIATKPE